MEDKRGMQLAISTLILFILGFVVFVGTIGGAVGPVLSGIIYDATGSYQSAFLLCLVLCILALIGVLFLRPTNGVDWNKATV